MAGRGSGDLRDSDLVRLVRELRDRVKTLELQAASRVVPFIAESTSTGSASYTRMAWSSFPRSGSSLSADVVVALSGASSVDVQLRADGVEVGVVAVSVSGAVSVGGFLPSTWPFGDRRIVDVRVKANGGGSVDVAVVGAWHR
ncbi:hypothetical protein SAMN05421505_12097 [Sinosporangium album]|uniref:Uncharacterized protein n=1 Tax=Sinosporangium album TaxID=504805 RepID=A0A1G8EGZ6_9ACTN|nr:hypothetical protein [Sinosporangium album]SDH69158.1 hypothetical protein SAMN05421505_12097 [Sinosporangium album]